MAQHRPCTARTRPRCNARTGTSSNCSELLQELRVTRTGVRILFAFLPSSRSPRAWRASVWRSWCAPSAARSC
ncbi:DUF6328 family protein [Streptomyces djakartensis]|uniref:DUF6328 family protein n=1 Tax=Streptomyces djakartensis TaxID=68193 RepID=UPI003F7E3A9C